LWASLISLVPTLGSVLIALMLALTLGIALLTLVLALRIALLTLVLALRSQGTKLGSKLRNLVLLLVDLGAKLIMKLLELASQLRGVTVPAVIPLRALSAATTTHPGVTARDSRCTGTTGHHALTAHVRLGAKLVQRHREVDSHVNQLMELFLHLVQFFATLLKVPVHALLVRLERLVDLLRELSFLPVLILLGSLTLGRLPRLSEHPLRKMTDALTATRARPRQTNKRGLITRLLLFRN